MKGSTGTQHGVSSTTWKEMTAPSVSETSRQSRLKLSRTPSEERIVGDISRHEEAFYELSGERVCRVLIHFLMSRIENSTENHRVDDMLLICTHSPKPVLARGRCKWLLAQRWSMRTIKLRATLTSIATILKEHLKWINIKNAARSPEQSNWTERAPMITVSGEPASETGLEERKHANTVHRWAPFTGKWTVRALSMRLMMR